MSSPPDGGGALGKPARQPRLRASCDGCFIAKVKCSKDRPMCGRCLQMGHDCKYSPSSRAGKVKADSISIPPHPQLNRDDVPFQPLQYQSIYNSFRFRDPYANQPMPNQQMPNQQMANQQMVNQQMANQQMANQQMVNQQMANQQMVNQQMANQQMAHPQMASPWLFQGPMPAQNAPGTPMNNQNPAAAQPDPFAMLDNMPLPDGLENELANDPLMGLPMNGPDGFDPTMNLGDFMFQTPDHARSQSLDLSALSMFNTSTTMAPVNYGQTAPFSYGPIANPTPAAHPPSSSFSSPTVKSEPSNGPANHIRHRSSPNIMTPPDACNCAAICTQTLNNLHSAPVVSLAEAMNWSSNINNVVMALMRCQRCRISTKSDSFESMMLVSLLLDKQSSTIRRVLMRHIPGDAAMAASYRDHVQHLESAMKGMAEIAFELKKRTRVNDIQQGLLDSITDYVQDQLVATRTLLHQKHAELGGHLAAMNSAPSEGRS
ncbi:40S ribosomal protein S16 [Pestalotiopsis sp. IQ-011]